MGALIQALLVDDEPMQLQGLVRHIRWTELGYAPPLTAESGEDALRLLEESPVDVLVTDVSMPGMTGIELLARCRSDLPRLQHLQTLVVSGFDEFEFVQEAIRYGAKGYVLKPVKTEEIEAKLTEFRSSLEKRERIDLELRELREKVDGTHGVVLDRFVNDLIEGRVRGEELLLSWKRLLDLPGDGTEEACLILFGHDRLRRHAVDDVEQRLMLGEGFASAIRVSFSDSPRTYVARTGADEVAAIALGPTPVERARLEKQLVFVQEVVQERCGSTATIGISRPGAGWMDVPRLYKEVKHMMARARQLGDGQIVRFDRFEESEFLQSRFAEDSIPEIVRLIEQGETAQAAAAFDRAFEWIAARERESFSYAQAFGMGLVSELVRKLKPYKETDGGVTLRMWQRLVDCSDVRGMRDVIWEYAGLFRQLGQKEKTAQQHNLVQRISAYMEEHLAENVTVKQLAELCHLNASYLSVLFKKETGQTLSEFIQELRMSKAKELLRDPGVKVYEVAEKVGFQTSAYFAYVFKKTTGHTPQEFRDYGQEG